jgi:HEAT repeat protein
MRFLGRADFPIVMRQMIARSLTEKGAHDIAFAGILALFRSSVRDAADRSRLGFAAYQAALANALAVMASKDDRATLKELAKDERYGNARAVFIDSMRQWRDAEVDEIVMAAVASQFVNVRYAGIQVAGSRRLRQAVPALTEAMGDSNKNIRSVAKKALDRIRMEGTARPTKR